MINTHHRKQAGFSVLALSVIVLLVITIATIYTARVILSEHQITGNVLRTGQAFESAQAGMEYAISYLEENRSTITDGQTISGTLADGSSYSVTYTFQGPESEQNSIVLITSTGSSVDDTATKTVKQTVKWAGVTFNMPSVPLSVAGSVSLSGNVEVKNLENNTTLNTGSGSVTISGNAQTTLASGKSSDSSVINSDITTSVNDLQSKTTDQLAMAYFGVTISQMQGFASTSYNNSGTTNYNSQLSGLTNEVVSISQNGGTARLNSNITIGSPGNPVSIVVDGSVDISGGVTIYGNIIATGSVSISGNSTINGTVFSGGSTTVSDLTGNSGINGALVLNGSLNMSGNVDLTYDSTILSQNTPNSIGAYGKVPGSWHDTGN